MAHASSATGHLGASELPCPDPSVHEKSTKLQEQASNAALYVTHAEKTSTGQPHSGHKHPILGADKRLSSASAATSLKYARQQDLPSFPVVGTDAKTSANKAANLASAKHQNFQHWKPDPSASAGKAALRAKDVKVDPIYQRPEPSAAGSKAALLAAREGGKVDSWKAHPTKEGNRAAGAAVRMNGLSPQIFQGTSKEGYNKALVAATGAASARPRAISNPDLKNSYPDAENASYNALNAATIANKPSRPISTMAPSTGDSEPEREKAALEAARIQHLSHTIPREMFTSHPPVRIEVEERNRRDALRASSISMAKQMYALQQQHIDRASGVLPSSSAAAGSHAAAHNAKGQPSLPANDKLRQQATQYLSLQEAAQKQAAERLARLEPDEFTAYRNYYGYNTTPARSRLSLRGHSRRRASSEGKRADLDDEEQSRRIRVQMFRLNDEVAKADDRKRQQDRDNVMAVAQRKVRASLHELDEKVFQETGKIPPAMLEEWEAKARTRAAADSEARMANHGKIHIGGGKYIEQSEADAVATAKLKPKLAEISETAERKRAVDEQNRLEAEERKREAALQKERDADTKAELKRAYGEIKAAEKAQKSEEKEKRKSKSVKALFSLVGRPGTSATPASGAEPVLVAGETTTAGATDTRENHQSAVSENKVHTAPAAPAAKVPVPSREQDEPIIEPTQEEVQPGVSAALPEERADIAEIVDHLDKRQVAGESIAAARPSADKAGLSAQGESVTANPSAKGKGKGIKSLFDTLKRRSRAGDAVPTGTGRESTDLSADRTLNADSAASSAPAPAPISERILVVQPLNIQTTVVVQAPPAEVDSHLSLSDLDDDDLVEHETSRGRPDTREGEATHEGEASAGKGEAISSTSPYPDFVHSKPLESPGRDSKFREQL